MPKKLRDSSFSIQTVALSDQARQAIESFPQELQNTVIAAARGNNVSKAAFKAYEQVNGESPEDYHHPHKAVISNSSFCGHEKFLIGGKLLGETLVHRSIDGSATEADGKTLSPSITAFLDLVDSKGIGFVHYGKNAEGTTRMRAQLITELESAQNLANSNNDFELERDLETIRVDLKKKNNKLEKRVRENGIASYENMGASFAGTKEDQLYQAMALQEMIEEVRVLKSYGGAATILPVFQNEITGESFILTAPTVLEGQRLVKIPTEKKIEDGTWVSKPSREVQDEMAAFFKLFPDHDPLHQSLYNLVLGATRFAIFSHTDYVNATEQDIFSCSDARTPGDCIGGRSISMDRNETRTPGLFGTRRDKKLTRGALLSLVHSLMNDRQVTLTHHGNCGAMNVVKDHYSKVKETVTKGFLSMVTKGWSVYKKVNDAGSTTLDRTTRYAQETGVPIEDEADCLSLQMLKNDYTAAQRVARSLGKPLTSIIALFINTKENGTNYIANPNKGAFVFDPVPSCPELGERFLLNPGKQNAKTPSRDAINGIRELADCVHSYPQISPK